VRSIAAAALALVLASAHGARAESLCGGQTVARIDAGEETRPQVRLDVGGVPRNVLLDTGATRSVLFADAPPGGAANIAATIGIAGLPAFDFKVRSNPSAPRGVENGAILGTDVLSKSSVVIAREKIEFSAERCDPQRLAAAGFRRVDERGFFAAEPTLRGRVANVPVLPLRIGQVQAEAQIDTGYGDRAYPFSIDINQAMLALLRQQGVALTRIGDVKVFTCQGAEMRDVYAAAAPLRLGAYGEAPLAETAAYVLIPKAPNGCGGIADWTMPGAQLAARFLDLFDAVALDGQGAAIWVKPK
jgi:hypothetical protein